ncbi:MAG: formylglycine-generating enzyme family protein [Planctomycetota bacterium]|nr:formylglycine-generating enzyme family protein [Planctomycetota bacterium]
MKSALTPLWIIVGCALLAFGVIQWVSAPVSEPEMVWIPGGEFLMGDDADAIKSGGAGPRHRVFVDGFFMDVTEVTNAQYARFVDSTGYKTVAERPMDPREFPNVPAAMLVPGAGVFSPPAAKVDNCDDCLQWWEFKPGYSWKFPGGPGHPWQTKPDHPVVYIAYEDAVAYAHWAKKRLPTEAEWEFAARGGLAGKNYAWGDESPYEGSPKTNIWFGIFPNTNGLVDGHKGSAPVKSYPKNNYGLFDMAGNVWEWCSDWYRPDSYKLLVESAPPDTVFANPKGPTEPIDPHGNRSPVRVQRSGSFLCAENYCQRYRVAWRGHGAVDTGLSHTGFRCVRLATPSEGKSLSGKP